MADRIIVSTDWLDRCRAEMRQVQNVLAEAASALGRVDLSHEAGGDKGVSFKPIQLTCGARISGGNVRSIARSIMNGINASGSDMSALVSALSASITLFNEIEKNTKNLILGSTEASGESSVYKDAAEKLVAAWKTTIAQWITRSDEMYRKFKEEQQRMEEMRKRNEERRRQSIEAANKRHVFEDDYNDKGILYGGKQHGPMEDRAGYDDYRDIIYKNTGRRLTDEQLAVYLRRMNNEGCGYMAMTNAIMMRYEGRAADFERDFGFPMYKNGELNYNELMVDIYSTTDNHSKGLFGGDKYNEREDYSSGDGFFDYDILTDDDGKGNNKNDVEYRLEKYLSDNGLDGNVKVYSKNKITVSNYAEMAKDGPIMISVGKPYVLRNADRSVYRESPNGHCMMITGVENGMFVVSSWGQKFYIDPNDKTGFTNFHQLKDA